MREVSPPLRLLLLPGDGIGPEVMGQLRRVLGWFEAHAGLHFHLQEELIGGAAYDAHQAALAPGLIEKAAKVDAIFLGAVGGPKWAGVPYEARPEAGLLALRKQLDLFANLRPAICPPALTGASALKPEKVEGLDIMIVRELAGGIYFGTPRGITQLGENRRRAVNTQVYDSEEIRRVGRAAFDLARTRRGQVTSVEKSNVMESGLLWREEITRLHREDYPDLALQHMLADNCAMQLVREPKQFDVIVTDNLFGDLLSDQAAMLTGSLGMLPSASLGAPGAPGLYEPVHGSAPDIAGRGQANPLAMILSLAMALRTGLSRPAAADRLEAAVGLALARGARTADIAGPADDVVTTAQMGDAVLQALDDPAPAGQS